MEMSLVWLFVLVVLAAIAAACIVDFVNINLAATSTTAG